MGDNPLEEEHLPVKCKNCTIMRVLVGCKRHDEISENHKEDTGPEVVDSSSVVTTLAEMVEENGRLFIGVRRGSPLNRVLSMWDREKKKNVA